MKQLGRLIFLLLFSLHGYAGEVYDLNKLIMIALDQNISLKLEEQSIQLKGISKINSDRLRWPNLSINSSTKNNIDDQTGSISVSLNQPIYLGGSISVKQNQARIELEKINLNMVRKKQSLKKDVKLAYIDLLEAIELEKEEVLSLIQLQKQARISKILYAEGDVWKNDVLQADVSIAQGETKVIAAKNRILLAKSALNILLNLDLSNDLEIKGDLKWQEYTWTWQQIVKIIENSHPDIDIAKFSEDIATLNISNKRAKNRPTVKLSSSAVHNEYFTSSSAATNSLNISLSASWNLWDAGNTTRSISNARIEKKKKSIELYKVKQNTLKKAQQNWLTFKVAKKQVAVLEQAINIAIENYRVNTVRYQEKLGTANDLLSAQKLLSKSKRDWISALARYLKSAYTLQYNLGQMEPSHSMNRATS